MIPPGPAGVGRAGGDVAIIGMAGLFPGAPDLTAYWQNILNKVDAVTDPPPGSWDPDVHYDPSSTENDRIYCQRAGYLAPIASFDPVEHGVMPLAVEGGEPDQWLALKVARAALADAGYLDRLESRQRTAVVIGKGTYINRGNLSMVQHGVMVDQTLNIIRGLHPELGEAEMSAIRQELKRCLPPLNAETAAGLIPNIIAGRIANRLDLMGPSYTIDAACASSLIAVQSAVRDLLTDECDLALVGGAQITTPVPIFTLFCQLGALSRRQQIRPFDKDADGTILGEGIGMVVLKRREDAERDGDRVYAVLKGVGTASDGRGVSVMAPRIEGEELALRRAYDAAQVDPRTVGLIEAHGTGTPVGDAAELEALNRVFGERGGDRLPSTALGSVKSMIGHTMPAAGMAGLIKASLALYHRVLAPTLNVAEPHPDLGLQRSVFYLNTEPRPWIHGDPLAPRRAGVNSFGFGGINAHAVLEEYPHADEATLPTHQVDWDSEALIFQADSSPELAEQAAQMLAFVEAHPDVTLKDLASTLGASQASRPCRLSIVASDLADLRDKLARASQRLADPACRRIKDAGGIYFFAEPLARQGKVAVLFPGEGAQYPNMLADLCLHFPAIRAAFDQIDRALRDHPRGYRPSQVIFPPPLLPADERDALERRLWEIDGALEGILAANQALWTLFGQLGVTPDVVLGHSAGEYSAMRAAGVLELDDDAVFTRFTRDLNRGYQEALDGDGVPTAAMLAVGADREQASTIVERVAANGALHVAMDNCPHQAVIVGERAAVETARGLAQEQGLLCELLAFDRAYHTPLFGPYVEHLRQIFARTPVSRPRVPIYSCTTAAPYPDDPATIRELMVDHWLRPVEFRATIERLYDEGVRVFLEAGPRGNVTAFVEDILRGKRFCAVPANVQRRSGIAQLNHCVAMLAAHGVDLDLAPLYRRRRPRIVEWAGAATGAPTSMAKRPEMKLAIGFPVMRLSDGLVESLRRRPGGPEIRGAADRPGDGHAAPAPARPAEPPAPGAEHAVTAPDIGVASVDDDRGVATLHSEPVDAAGDCAASSMQAYFRTMERFLAVQDEVMRAYLQGPAGSAAIGHEAPAAAAAYPTQDLEPTAPQVAVPAPHPLPHAAAPDPTAPPAVAAPPDAPMPASVPRPDGPVEADQGGAGDPTAHLLDLVSHRTGYPIEMLDLDLDLEADLGIDSIKRVEILGTLRRERGDLGVDLEQLTSQRTFRQILDVLNSASPVEHAPSRPADPAPDPRPLPSEAPNTLAFPLLGEVVAWSAGEELVTRRTFDMEEDRYLLDHTFGRSISKTDRDLVALAVMPLTMSLEILAEGAACLVPDRTVVGLRDVRAYRWIAFDDRPQTLQVTARRSPGPADAVSVQIRNLTEDGASGDPPKSPVLEATVLLADAYPVAPAAPSRDLEGGGPSRWRADRLYRDGMFHGPRWQGVVAVDQTGDRGIVATLRVLPFDSFFGRVADPRFVLDPVVLDAAGQVIAFWTLEHLPTGRVIFPFSLDALDLYGPPRQVGEAVRCAASVQLSGEHQVRSDIDLIAADGRVWMRLVGWADKRFDLPDRFYPLLLATGEADVSSPWPGPIERFPKPELVQCRRVPSTFPSDTSFWKQVWAHAILSRAEREYFRDLRTPEPAQLRWLAGRAAAKDAVRHVLRQHYGLDLAPADVVIVPDERGRPVVGGTWQQSVAEVPLVSISHAGGWAVAVAGLPGQGVGAHVGIDLEPLRSDRPDGFVELVFSEDERRHLEQVPDELAEEQMLRWWCAKEAAAKALGYGLVEGPRSVVVVGDDPATEVVAVQLTGQLARAYPHLAAEHLLVYTGRHDDLVFATTLCEPAGVSAAAAMPTGAST